MRNKKRKKSKFNKGRLYSDEGVDWIFENKARELGFEVKSFPPFLKNSSVSDTKIAEFAKHHPIITTDHTAYKETIDEGESTYVIVESVGENFREEYLLNFEKFLKPHTSKSLRRRKKWIVKHK